MFSKVDVNGPTAAPLYAYLREQAPREDGNTDISWNFAKFLVDKDGTVIKRYSPRTTPEEIAADLDAVLK